MTVTTVPSVAGPLGETVALSTCSPGHTEISLNL